MGRKTNHSRTAKRLLQVIISSSITLAIIGALYYGSRGRDFPVLSPSGVIAEQQFLLIVFTAGLGLFVVVPVFILLFSIAHKYRADNKKAKYEPDMKDNTLLEVIWWGIPCLIIIVLAVVTWFSTHALDPYRELESKTEPLNVQVVALNHNWLFLYPDYNIATLNTLTIPQSTPINFTITADAPMNSFWIPALGGQVYAMTGMSTKLHLQADEVGVYNGQAANINGASYAAMRFKVYAVHQDRFDTWLSKTANTTDYLSSSNYPDLAGLKERGPEKSYSLSDKYLYDQIVMKYMNHSTSKTDDNTHDMNHDEADEVEGMHNMSDMNEGAHH